MKTTKFMSSLFSLSLCLAMLLNFLPFTMASAASPNIVISQVYGGGGNSGATYKNDFIELYNLGADPVDVTGWSVQYASSTGSTWSTTVLSGSIQPGRYYLVKEFAGAGGTKDLPWPDATGTLAMGGSAGKVALVNNPTALTGLCPGGWVDMVGYGSATNCSETSPTANLSNTTAALRKNNGAQDTDNNLSDFNIGSPLPRNSVYPFDALGLATPSTVNPGANTLLTVNMTPAPDSTGMTVNADLTPIGGSAFQAFYDDGTHGDVTAGDNIFSVNTAVSLSTPAGSKTLFVTASDQQGRTTHANIYLTVGAPVITSIADARALSPGSVVTVDGNVTVVPGKFSTRTFVIQDSTGGIYIYPSDTPPAMVLGDVIRVQGALTVHNNLVELGPVAAMDWMSTGTVPTPLTTTTGNISATQGKLVEVDGTITSVAAPYMTINDGSGDATVYIYSGTGISLDSYSTGMRMRIIGFSGAHHEAQVNPRYQTDLYVFPPTVTSTYPADGTTDVSLYRPLTATFDHPMDITTINTTTFTLNEPTGLVSGIVSYDAGTKTASFIPDSILSENTPYTATLTTAIKDEYDIPLSSVYTWTFTSGMIDVTSPTITGRMPAPGEMDVALDASVVISYSEGLTPASVDYSDYQLVGPYGDVPFNLDYDPSTFAATLNPDFDLLPSSLYTATARSTVEDWAGNAMSSSSTWTFTTMAEPAMYVYLGDLHNHTSYSDGSGTPTQALAAGESAGLDFMAITDHSYAITDLEWDTTLTAVEAATNPDFVAIRGFEYTQGAEGHVNVYNTVRHAVRTNTGCGYCDYTPNLEPGSTVQGFYQWLDTTGTIGLDQAGTVMQFNHPGWINFNDWKYHSEVSNTARLEEVGNGNGTSYAFSEDQYVRSLDYGWKVGATNNADTHSTEWGTNTDHRTGVVMPELTKDDLLDALRLRRTFASEDKNYSLTMKANGAWMGSEIPNVGSIQFEINGADPDGEQTVMVQIITDQGVVAAQYEPNTASYTLTPSLEINTGVHYYYIRVTEADGDRIVSSPIWTTGMEDISVTDLLIQPTIPTINNPSLLTVRVTNRVEVTRTVTVALEVNGTPLDPSTPINVTGNGDAFANFTWQPETTGVVAITARISGTPPGDNPDDNQRSLNLNVTAEHLPLILIDAGKGNLNAEGNEMQVFITDLSNHRYNVLKNLDELTPSDLNPAVVKLLLITAPEQAYSAGELSAISNYVAAGGNLWLVGMSDYTGSVSWAGTVADRENAILAAIETATGSPINMRVNDDEIIDGNNNNGYVFGPRWSIFPSTDITGIGVNVEAITSWSANSLRGTTVADPLTPGTPGVEIIAQGDLDDGYMNNPPYYDPFHTSNQDADNSGDAYIYNPTWVYPSTRPPDAIPVPMSAATDLPGNPGRILLSGDSNDAFTTYAYTAGDGLQNELFNLEAVMWLMGEPLQKLTIAEARAQTVVNHPNNLDKLVWVDGYITAAYGEFFNVLYVQDETGGITVHAPAGDIDPTIYTRGTHVRVVGTVGIYNGDTEIEFFEAEMVQVLDPGAGEILPIPMNTFQASMETNQGWLSMIVGTVTAKQGEATIIVNDGSGPVRVFLDGYNGNFSDLSVNDLVRVTGLVSEDGDGQRIRVRNHLMHPGIADDVVRIVFSNKLYITVIGR